MPLCPSLDLSLPVALICRHGDDLLDLGSILDPSCGSLRRSKCHQENGLKESNMSLGERSLEGSAYGPIWFSLYPNFLFCFNSDQEPSSHVHPLRVSLPIWASPVCDSDFQKATGKGHDIFELGMPKWPNKEAVELSLH